MENTDYYLQQKLIYVKERTLEEESIPQHIKQEYGGKLDLNKFISDIINLHEEFLNKIETENIPVYSNDDEYYFMIKYIVLPIYNFAQETVDRYFEIRS